MAFLLGQPPEVLHSIFQYVEPIDISSLAKTCNHFNSFVESDDLLWKKQYLQILDAPLSKNSEDFVHWKSRVKGLVRTKKILESENCEIKDENLEQVLHDCIELVTTSSTKGDQNVAYVKNQFRSRSNISSFLCRSSLFKYSGYIKDKPAASAELRQLSAKLHVFSGLNVEPGAHARESTLARPVHPFARARVYDLRRYTDNTFWGPFMDDGSGNPDWEKLQAIMVDLYFNLADHPRRTSRRDSTLGSTEIFSRPFFGLGPDSYQSLALDGKIAPRLTPELDLQDPYGVTGTWMRMVCFLDYNDLFHFNFENDDIPDDQERPPISTREAFRLIKLSLRVSKVEPPGPEEHPDFPVVHFSGKSRSQFASWDPNANSRIRGIVRTMPTKPPTIRWTTFSIFHGEERWRSEGVQLGFPPNINASFDPSPSSDSKAKGKDLDPGPDSDLDSQGQSRRPNLLTARGIFGNWFDKDYDPHGPAGPTAFWKISDDILEDNDTNPYAHGAHQAQNQHQPGLLQHANTNVTVVGNYQTGNDDNTGEGAADTAAGAADTNPQTTNFHLQIQINGITHPLQIPLNNTNPIGNLNLLYGALAAHINTHGINTLTTTTNTATGSSDTANNNQTSGSGSDDSESYHDPEDRETHDENDIHDSDEDEEDDEDDDETETETSSLPHLISLILQNAGILNTANIQTTVHTHTDDHNDDGNNGNEIGEQEEEDTLVDAATANDTTNTTNTTTNTSAPPSQPPTDFSQQQ